MIIGLGIDLVELDRISRSLSRFGLRFADKIMHASELAALPGAMDAGNPAMVAHIAARFAAKEAGAKALGTGFAQGVGLKDIRILSLPSGKPELFFHGEARKRADALGTHRVHLSLSHGRDAACAVVILEAGETAASLCSALSAGEAQ